MGNNITLHSYTETLSDSKFTNVYDLSFRPENVEPSIELHSHLTSVFDYVQNNFNIKIATGGGFFFLVDEAKAKPKQFALNLALQNGRVHGFPVVDREAVVINEGRLGVEYMQALGVLATGNTELSWSGSLTEHETDAKVFGVGNSVISHFRNKDTGSVRVLDDNSRYTPAIENDDMIDIGFSLLKDGSFASTEVSNSGNLDIFSHDVVVRTHERHAHNKLPNMTLRELGGRAIDGSIQGALSVGPMLETEDFSRHSINKDASLGGKPPFLDVPLARTVLYETSEGKVHIQLFDGRPGSSTFPGVTPDEVVSIVKQREDVTWGCFLDPGQTAKLAVRNGDDIASYGNTHYLKWPNDMGEKFIWVPKTGRPVASSITLR